MKVSEVLTKAADHIEEVGWYQGRLAFDTNDADSPCCALGAINWAIGGMPYMSEWQEVEENVELFGLAVRACGVLRQAVGAKSVPAWNDGDRTQEEVVRGLREGAKLALELGL